MPDENDKNLNPGQTDYNRKTDFDPSGSKVNENSDESVAKNSDENIDNLREAENNPDSSYKNNFTGNNKSEKKSFFAKLKSGKNGPIIAVSLITLLFGAGTISLISPSLIGPSILANIISKFNTNQEVSANYRMNKLFSKMLVEDVTDGSCTVVKVYCRFNGVSPKMLKKLKTNGITALDIDGNEITKTGMIFQKKPKFYAYTSSTGKDIKVGASDFFKTISTNVELSSAFRSATNSRFMSLTDNVFKSIKVRLGFSTSNKLADVTDEKAIVSEIDDAIKNVDDDAAKLIIAEGGEDANKAVTNIIEEKAEDAADKVVKGGKSGLAQLGAAAICVATDMPGIITSASRAIQITQLAKYSAYFLSAFGAIKAGDATSAEATAVGNMLTKTKNGKSAMDSTSMKYVMTGDTSFADTSHQKYVPGLKTSQLLSSTTEITDSPEKKAACAVGMNPATGLALDAAAATTVVGLVPALANFVAGSAAAVILEPILPSIIKAVVDVIPMDKLSVAFFGDITKDLDPDGIGHVNAIAPSHIIGQVANAGGNQAMTIPQQLAFDKLSDKYENQIAKEERATKSPFDISSKYTLLGSIFSSFSSIYYSSFNGSSSILNGLGFIGNTVTKSFASLFNSFNVSALDDGSREYSLCTDPSIAGKVAAGPFCNIMYGIPTEYLDKEPNLIINELINTKQIDVETGNPIPDSDYDRWVGLCTDGEATQAENCVIQDNKTANYALYTIDHRIVEYFNGDSK